MRNPEQDPALIQATERLKSQNATLSPEASPEETTEPELTPEETPEVVAKPEPEVVAEPTPVPEPEPVQEPQPEGDPLEERIAELTRRLDTAAGRYGSELSELRTQLSESMDTNARLLTVIEGSQAAPPTEETPTGRGEMFAGIPAEALDGYDSDSLDVIVKVAQNVARSMTEAAVAPVQESVRDIKQSTSQDSFLLEADRVAPGFISANGDGTTGADPEWVAFLDTTRDPEVSGETWRSIIEREGTPKIAGAVFLQFLKAKTATAPAAAPKAKPPTGVKRPTLEEQATPKPQGGATAQSASGEPAAKVLTRAGYADHMRQMSKRGGFTEETKAQMREYQQADLEGRLT